MPFDETIVDNRPTLLEMDLMFLAGNPNDPVARHLDRRSQLVGNLPRPRRLAEGHSGGTRSDLAGKSFVGRRSVEAFRIFLRDESGGDLARTKARMLHQRR